MDLGIYFPKILGFLDPKTLNISPLFGLLHIENICYPPVSFNLLCRHHGGVLDCSVGVKLGQPEMDGWSVCSYEAAALNEG